MYDGPTLNDWITNNLSNGYLGIFPRDQLPNIRITNKLPLYFIINLDHSHLSGTHWVCIIIHKKCVGEVFDSFGNYPNCEIKKWMNEHCNFWYYNTKMVQSPLSTSCGLFCLYFLDYRIQHGELSLNKFMNTYFDYDVNVNENLVTNHYYSKL